MASRDHSTPPRDATSVAQVRARHNAPMDPRLSVLTLGVPDLAEARRFYVDGLGWEPTMEVDGEIVFIQIGHGVLLALWRAEALAADVGEEPNHGTAGISLGHNVDSEQEVADVLARAEAAGGTILKPAQPAQEFGGFQGYFADPAGYRWDVVYNPGLTVDADGRVRFGPV
jgi:catechol 2,3-dioxygenase-like lactoylglutathione lyase family enzyme